MEPQSSSHPPNPSLAQIGEYQTNPFSLPTHTKSNHLPYPPTNPPASRTMRSIHDHPAAIPHRPGRRLPHPNRRPPHLPAVPPRTGRTPPRRRLPPQLRLAPLSRRSEEHTSE